MDKVNGMPASNDKFNKILADGKVTGKEVAGLSPAEQAELSELLGGRLPEGDEEINLLPEASVTAKAGKSGVKVKDIFAGVAGLGTLGVLVAGAAGVISGPVVLAAAAVGGIAVLASCQKFDPPEVNVEQKAEQNVNVKIDYANSSIEDLLQAIKDDLASLKEIVNGLIQANRKLEDIFNLLSELGKSVNEITKILVEQGAKIDQIIALLVENNSVLNEISKGNKNIEELLKQINQAVKDGNEIGANNGELLKQILAKLGSINGGSGDNKDVLALLEAILAKVTEGVQNGKDADAANRRMLQIIIDKLDDMDKAHRDLLLQVINKMNNITPGGSNDDVLAMLDKILAKLTEDVENDKKANDAQMRILQQILDKIDSMSADQKAFFNAVLDAIGKLGEQSAASLEKVLEAINNNTEIAKGSQEVLKLILAKMDQLGDKADTIIDLISNLAVGGGGDVTVKVDLSTIEDLLRQILAKTDENGKTLSRIEDKLDFMKAVLDQIKPAIEQLGDDMKAKLQAIYDKIEPCKGHECDHSVIIEILKEIKEALGEAGDHRHEGVLDDLEDLFG